MNKEIQMKMKIKLAVLVAFVMGFGSAYAETDAATAERLAALEEQIQALTGEVEKDRFGDVIPELGESIHGMGPAASKVYNKDQGLSIGGYGEVLYENHNGSDNTKSDQIDMLRAILYFGYKFNDKWVLNTEIELEHADEAFVEFAYLDYLHDEALNFRGGLVLVPVGIVNELHEPTVFLGAKRTMVENKIIPTTWRENGGGIFGDIGAASYKLYVVNSLDATVDDPAKPSGGFTAGGIRGGRQKGSKAKAEDFSVVGRLDYEIAQGITIGGSVYGGEQGQDVGVDAGFVLGEAHIMARKGGFTFNALAVGTKLSNADDLNDANSLTGTGNEAGEQMFGWYTELGYDILSGSDKGELQLTPYVRLEQVDTQSKKAEGSTVDADAYDYDIVTVGLNFKPIDEVVLKLEHQFIRNGNSDKLDQTNFALGYVF
jgi:hypothetical protein